MRQTQGSETSQYLEEKKSNEIPSVAASEGGRAQTQPTTNISISWNIKYKIKESL